MSGILIAILVISAVAFVGTYVRALIEDEKYVSLTSGTFLVLILWKPLFVLALILLIFTCIGLLINVLKYLEGY